MSGAPVFVGTRVPLQTFFDYLEGDAGLAEFIEDFPHLQDKVFQLLEITMRTTLEQERIDFARLSVTYLRKRLILKAEQADGQHRER